MTVLVTGGSGFVGQAVIAALLRKKHRVIATATALSANLPAAAHLLWVSWNARAEAVPHVSWDGVDAVLHLAVPRQPFDFPAGAAETYDVTVAATFRLLEVARVSGVRRVLLASTADVLGTQNRAATESDVAYAPSSFYGATKAGAELLVRAYQSTLQTAVLRVFHPYGPGGERFLVNRLVTAVAEEREVRIEGPNGILLNPVWLDELALGVCAALESDATGIFHFAGPDTVTLRQLLETAGELTGRAPRIQCAPCAGVQRHYAACERSAQLLGFAPRVTVREGIRRLVAGAG